MDTSGTEENWQNQQTTMMAENKYRPDFVALRTVPVVLSNVTRTLKVNALLDDASTKTYLNADVAAELGLQGQTEKVTVNVLNDKVETFETKPVTFKLESLDGNISMSVNAYTANKVTGNLSVVDWNQYKRRWAHLQSIDFPWTAKRPIVDIPIGVDCADVLCSISEVRGRPGKPIARLTPLGWTCVGNLGSYGRSVLQTIFSYTYFAKDKSERDTINETFKKFWEIEESQTIQETPIVRIDEQLAIKIVEKSMQYEDQMYRIGVQWKENEPSLLDSYVKALLRLETR